MSARYRPGRWLAISGPDCWGLFDLAPTDPRGGALHAALAGPQPVEAALELLLADGLAAMPGFVVVDRAGTSLRYVVRHPATLRIDGLAVAPDRGLTWTDALVEAGRAAEVTLQAAGAAYAEGGELRLETGVTSASRIDVSFATPPSPSPELIDGVPWATGPTSTPVVEPPRSTPSDVPSPTRLRPAAPLVWAVRCPAGHLTSPYSPVCRVCATPVPEQPPVQVARPALGRLVLSTGEVVTLDRDVVLGRAPQPTGGGRHHLVTITAASEVSRSHAEVRLEEWHVLLRDLGSANGTVLTLPGRRPEQIRPGEDHHLEPGCTVSLADVAGFRFEVTPSLGVNG